MSGEGSGRHLQILARNGVPAAGSKFPQRDFQQIRIGSEICALRRYL
jgi:hypothetical protein